MRHAEAQKNVEDRHGGQGSGLTENGELQARNLAEIISVYFDDVVRLITPDLPHCKLTAEVLAEALPIDTEVASDLRPYNLGVLDGLTREEANERFPEFALGMERWRNGLTEIQTLNLPGSTDPVHYYETGLSALTALLPASGTLLLVASRSILVMLWNALHQRPPIEGGGYFERPWENLEWIEFIQDDHRDQWTELRTQRSGSMLL